MVQALEEFLNDLSKHGWELEKIASKYAYQKSAGPAKESKEAKDSATKAKKTIESKVAANKAAALAVIAGKKGGRIGQLARAQK